MEKIIYFILLSFLFIGCEKIEKQEKNEQKEKIVQVKLSPEQKYEKKLQKELESGVKFKNFFLMFNFGDSMEETFLNLNVLYLAEEIERNESGDNIFNLTLTSSSIVKAYIIPAFHEDKLHKLTLYFSKTINPHISIPTLATEISNFYKKKYGEYDYYVKSTQKKIDAKWITGNRGIEIDELTASIFVNYIDKDIETILNKIEEDKKKQAIKKSEDDI